MYQVPYQVPGTWYRVQTDVVYMWSLVFCGFFPHTLQETTPALRVENWGHKQEKQKHPIFEQKNNNIRNGLRLYIMQDT